MFGVEIDHLNNFLYYGVSYLLNYHEPLKNVLIIYNIKKNDYFLIKSHDINNYIHTNTSFNSNSNNEYIGRLYNNINRNDFSHTNINNIEEQITESNYIFLIIDINPQILFYSLYLF